jgi:hypothetical protein
MSGFLITPSLYSAWKYWKYWKDSEDTGEEEMIDLLDTLNKVKREKSPAIQRGIYFENAVRGVCDGTGVSDDFCVMDAAEIVEGGLWQQRVSRELDGDLTYGIADVIRSNTIYDIKRVFEYDLGKYEGSIQHLIYMYATGIPNFEYVISDGIEIYVETYHWEAGSLETLRDRIAEMKGSLLSDEKMRRAFLAHWRYRKDRNEEPPEPYIPEPRQNNETEIQRVFDHIMNREINSLKRDMNQFM